MTPTGGQVGLDTLLQTHPFQFRLTFVLYSQYRHGHRMEVMLPQPILRKPTGFAIPAESGDERRLH